MAIKGPTATVVRAWFLTLAEMSCLGAVPYKGFDWDMLEPAIEVCTSVVIVVCIVHTIGHDAIAFPMKTKRNELVFRVDFWRNRHYKTIPAFEHCLCSVHVLDMQGEDDLAVPVWAGECDAAVNLALAGTVDPDFADDGRT